MNTMMQEVTQTTIETTNTVVKVMKEVTDTVKDKTGRDIAGSGDGVDPKTVGHY